MEKVYENALFIELTEMGLKAERQKRVLVYYKNQVVGDYTADLTVEDVVICELKANEKLVVDNEYQLVNYLKATTIEVGLLEFWKKAGVAKKNI